MEDAVDHVPSVEADGRAAQGVGEGACDNRPRSSRLYDRLARAHSTRDGLRERAVPSPAEIRIKQAPGPVRTNAVPADCVWFPPARRCSAVFASRAVAPDVTTRSPNRHQSPQDLTY